MTAGRSDATSIRPIHITFQRASIGFVGYSPS